MAKYLVTGGAGFIGSNIVEELVKENQSVRVLDNFSTGRRENIAGFLDKIELIEGDIRDKCIAQKAVSGADFVLHQAALPSVARSIEDPVTTTEVNINGTLNMLIAAKEAGVKRFVFASSSSVYGKNKELPKHEDMMTMPISPYAVAKLTGEKFCQVFHGLHGLETVMLRYFNVFGPRQNPNSQYSAVIPKFIKAIRNNEQPEIHGDGLQSRDFTFVKNNVRANLLACHAPDIGGMVFNIACSTRINLLDLLKMIGLAIGKEVQPRFTDARPGDIKHSLADISLAKRHLRYQPQFDMADGIQQTVNYFLRQGEVA